MRERYRGFLETWTHHFIKTFPSRSQKQKPITMDVQRRVGGEGLWIQSEKGQDLCTSPSPEELIFKTSTLDTTCLSDTTVTSIRQLDSRSASLARQNVCLVTPTRSDVFCECGLVDIELQRCVVQTKPDISRRLSANGCKK